MNDKNWKEKTKLNKRNKIMITFYIIMAIFEIITAIAEKDFTWVIPALLWATLAVNEYCNTKILKGKEYLIDIQNEHIKIQNKMFDDMLEHINRKRKIIKISDIKIQKKFKAPNKEKLDRRYTYFDTNAKFEVPIVVDSKNNLIDGYTSYLIAKHYKFSHVEVEER